MTKTESSEWLSVDSQSDLDELSALICWEDSSTLAFHGSYENQPHFPNDICLSGHQHPHLTILIDADSHVGNRLEIVFIAAEHYASAFLERPFVGGRIDSLRRVTIRTAQAVDELRCARVIYRIYDDDFDFDTAF